MMYGINAHLRPDKLEQIDRAADLGVSWVRLDFDWDRIEPRPNAYQWDICERVVDRAISRGLRMMATLAYTPGWANGGKGRHYLADVDQTGRWSDFVGLATARFAGRVWHWGLGNEPNLLKYFRDGVDAYIERQLIPGARAAKASNPNCLICAPDLADTPDALWELWRVIRKAGRHIDILTHHLYKPGTRTELAKRLVPLSWLARIARRDLWITETGWETGPDPISEAAQAENLRGYMDCVRRYSRIRNTFIYDIIDDPNPVDPMRFGLYRANLTIKPAGAELRRALTEVP